MHRAIWRTKTPGPENLQSTGSTGEHSTGISLDLLLGKTEKALVKERREDRDDGDDDERGYSIKLIQSRKIVQEKFENGDAKQSETRISHRPRRLTDPNNQEQQGEQRPRDAVAHVARKVSGKLKREHGAERVKQRLHVATEHKISRRRKKSRGNEEANCHDTIGVKIPVKNRRCGTGMITEDRRVYREPRKCNHEQSSSHQPQPRMRHAMDQPTESSALKRPAKRDPLAIKLNGKDKSDEKQRH